jgi:hypothetical protein
LGEARAGDLLEIVSDDQAFDAVGDLAATQGVLFRRLSLRNIVRESAAGTSLLRVARSRGGRNARRQG